MRNPILAAQRAHCGVTKPARLGLNGRAYAVMLPALCLYLIVQTLRNLCGARDFYCAALSQAVINDKGMCDGRLSGQHMQQRRAVPAARKGNRNWP